MSKNIEYNRIVNSRSNYVDGSQNQNTLVTGRSFLSATEKQEGVVYIAKDSQLKIINGEFVDLEVEPGYPTVITIQQLRSLFNSNINQKYTTTLTLNESSPIKINHGFNTRDIHISVYDEFGALINNILDIRILNEDEIYILSDYTKTDSRIVIIS